MKKYLLENLDCGICAEKIETLLKKQDFVKEVSIDFSTTSMLIDTEQIDKVIELIKTSHPEINIKEKETNSHIKQADEKNNFRPKKELLMVGICFIVFITAFLIYHNPFTRSTEHQAGRFGLDFYIFILIYITSGYHVLFKAFNNIRRRQFFDEIL